MTNKSHSALVVLDGMIDHLCREGPGKVATSASFRLPDLTRLLGCDSSQVAGCVSRSLGAKVLSTRCDQITISLGQNGMHSLKLARAGLEALYDHLDSKIWKFDTVSLLSAYRRMATWPIQDFVANAKYWVAYPLARILGAGTPGSLTSLPPNPPKSYCDSEPSDSHLGFGPSILYTGSVKRFLKNRLVSFTAKNLRLAMTLLQGVKRGAETVPASFIHEAMLKHRAVLTKQPHYSWYHMSLFEPLFKRFYKGMKPSVPRLLEASHSASFEAPRSSGGARGFLQQEFHGLGSSRPLGSGNLLQMYEYRPGEVRSIEGFHPPTFTEVLNRILYRTIDEPGGLRLFEPSLHASFEKVRLAHTIPPLPPGIETDPEDAHLGQGAAVQPPLKSSVMVSAVLEPLKVRLITKGESWKYWFSRFYQQDLWRELQRRPQFIATGRVLGISDFHALVDRESRLGLHFPMWVSGDYSAATDNVKVVYTKMAFEASLRASGVDPVVAGVLRRVLYEQELNYPLKEDIPSAMQTSGQLMGSTLSFPILCAINLVAYWAALELYTGLRIPFNALPVLVNGDDILFRCNRTFYMIWLDMIGEMGFVLSLGKNYVHERFFTINSKAYLWTADFVTRVKHGDYFYIHHGPRIEEIPYLNIGLLLGQSKLQGHESEQSRPLWDSYSRVISGSESKARTHRRFLHYHREEIDELTQKGNYSLFISPVFGGLGFPLCPEVANHGGPEGGPVRFTAFQRKFGGFLKSLSRNEHFGEFKDFPIWRGLVSPRKSKVATVSHFHLGHFISQPEMFVLRENERVAVNPKQMLLLPLALGDTPAERPALRVRRPDRKVLAQYRKGPHIAVKPVNLLEDDHVVVEVTEPVEDLLA